MPLIEIAGEKCTGCGICVKACPVGILIQEESIPTTIEKIEKGCITCGHCAAACPTAALAHCRINREECDPLEPGWRLTPQQIGQLVKGRRSIRNFAPKLLERETVAALLEIVRYAPTGMNSQSVHWKVILDEQEVQFLALEVVEWIRTLEGEEVHGARGMLKAWEMGRDPILRKAPALIIAHGSADDPMAPASATIALTTLELAALPFGLGACWAGFLHIAAARSPGVATALGLPPGHRMLGGLMIGYPEFEYARIPTRNPARVTWE